jgi:predicted anti-sigma-YlaC factor YlaD
MFKCFSPAKVDLTRVEIDPHLRVCSECRSYLKWMYEEEKKEFEEGKK